MDKRLLNIIVGLSESAYKRYFYINYIAEPIKYERVYNTLMICIKNGYTINAVAYNVVAAVIGKTVKYNSVEFTKAVDATDSKLMAIIKAHNKNAQKNKNNSK